MRTDIPKWPLSIFIKIPFLMSFGGDCSYFLLNYKNNFKSYTGIYVT